MFANSPFTIIDTAIIRSSRLVAFCKFRKTLRKNMCWSLVLHEAANLQCLTLPKKRLQRRCFLVIFSEEHPFYRTSSNGCFCLITHSVYKLPRPNRPPGYFQSANGPMVSHALRHMMYGYIYIYIYICIYIIYIYISLYLYIQVCVLYLNEECVLGEAKMFFVKDFLQLTFSLLMVFLTWHCCIRILSFPKNITLYFLTANPLDIELKMNV